MKKVAVFLCGSGFKDGSEIRESVCTLLALSQEGAGVQCFAPDAPQADVVNTFSGETDSQDQRNMLIEASRIARGKIKPLKEFKPQDFDALIIPGGFGVAKNFCDFATKGAQATVRPEVKTALEGMHALRKPIGAICIAPVLLALTFKGKNIALTLGAKSEASQEVEKLGQKHIVCAPNGCHVDDSFRMITTPAYMYEDAPLHEISIGIHKLVKETLRLVHQ